MAPVVGIYQSRQGFYTCKTSCHHFHCQYFPKGSRIYEYRAIALGIMGFVLFTETLHEVVGVTRGGGIRGNPFPQIRQFRSVSIIIVERSVIIPPRQKMPLQSLSTWLCVSFHQVRGLSNDESSENSDVRNPDNEVLTILSLPVCGGGCGVLKPSLDTQRTWNNNIPRNLYVRIL